MTVIIIHLSRRQNRIPDFTGLHCCSGEYVKQVVKVIVMKLCIEHF